MSTADIASLLEQASSKRDARIACDAALSNSHHAVMAALRAGNREPFDNATKGWHARDVDAIHAAHSRQYIAGINGSYESVCRFNCDDLRDLRYVEQSSHPRHQVLADRGGRSQQVAVALREADDEGRQVLGEWVGVVLGIGHTHLRDAGAGVSVGRPLAK